MSVDQIDVGIEIELLESVQSVDFLFISGFLLVLFLLQKMVFDIICRFPDFVDALFMELHEFLLAVKDFFQELFSPRTSSHLMTASHLLLKPIKRPCLLL